MRYRVTIEFDDDFADHDHPAMWNWPDLLDQDLVSVRVQELTSYPTPTPTSRMIGSILAVTGLIALLGVAGWVESWL